MTSLGDPIFAHSLAIENVLPTVRRSIPARINPGTSIQLFDPNGVNVAEVSGDYNFVVEVSAGLCLRAFDLDYQRTYLQLTISPSDLKSFFAGQSTTFTSALLNEMAATDPTQPTTLNGALIPPKGLTVVLTFKPISLTFGAGQTVTLGYRASVAVGTVIPHVVDDNLGTIDVSISAPWSLNPTPSLAQVDVLADLSTSTVTISAGPSDAERMLAAGLFGTSGSLIRSFLLYKPKVHLTPTICLVGKDNPANVAVPEFQAFEPHAKVVEWFGAQALAVAVQLNPSCTPLLDDVQHFIGFYDFGTISDELVVSGLFCHKWNLGGFLRHYPTSVSVQVTVNKEPQDATLRGSVNLKTLDTVVIETDSNTRTDYIGLAGSASVAADELILADNTVIMAGDPSVDFGSPAVEQWGVKCPPAVSAVPPSDALARQFLQTAYRDAYRHLCRPFARFPDPGSPTAADPVYVPYVRTEAIAARVFSLATVAEVFI